MTDSDKAPGLFGGEPAPDFADQAGYSPPDEEGHAEESQAATPTQAEDTGGDPDPKPDDEFVPSYLDDALQATLRDNPDLSVREFFQANKDELGRHWLRNDSYTKRRMSEKEELRKLQEPAQRWTSLTQNLSQAQQRQILSIIDGEAPVAEPESSGSDMPEGSEDWTLAEYHAWYSKQQAGQAEAMAAKIVDERLGKLAEQQSAPVRHAQALDAVALEWAESEGLDVEALRPLAEALEKKYGLENLNPKLLPGLLADQRTLSDTTSRLQQIEKTRQDTARKTSQARAASPRGGVGASAPKAPTPTTKPRHGFASAESEYESGFERLLESRGQTEAELDRTIGA